MLCLIALGLANDDEVATPVELTDKVEVPEDRPVTKGADGKWEAADAKAIALHQRSAARRCYREEIAAIPAETGVTIVALVTIETKGELSLFSISDSSDVQSEGGNRCMSDLVRNYRLVNGPQTGLLRLSITLREPAP